MEEGKTMERATDPAQTRIERTEGYQPPLVPCRTTPPPQSDELRDLLGILSFMQLQGTPSRPRKHHERTQMLHKKVLLAAKSCGFDVWQGLWSLAALEAERRDSPLARDEPEGSPAFDAHSLSLGSATQASCSLLRSDLTVCTSTVVSGPLRRPDPAVKDSISSMAHWLDDNCIMPKRPGSVRKRQRCELQLGHFSEASHPKQIRLETPIQCASSEPDTSTLWRLDVEDALARRVEVQCEQSLLSILSFLQPFVAPATAADNIDAQSESAGDNASVHLNNTSSSDSDCIRWDHILLAASQQKGSAPNVLMNESVVRRAHVRLQNLFNPRDADELRILSEKPNGCSSMRPW